MNKNIRRFATVVTLTAVLAGTTPAFAGPRNGGDVSERPALVRIVQKMLQKLFGLTTNSGISIPIPPNSPDAP